MSAIFGSSQGSWVRSGLTAVISQFPSETPSGSNWLSGSFAQQADGANLQTVVASHDLHRPIAASRDARMLHGRTN